MDKMLRRAILRRPPPIWASTARNAHYLPLLAGSAKTFPNQQITLARVKLFGKGGFVRKWTFRITFVWLAFQAWRVLLGLEIMKYADELDLGRPLTEEEEKTKMFIPLPFTTRKLARMPYGQSSPELAAFLAFSKDKEAMKNVKNNCVSMVEQSVLHSRHARDCGIKSDTPTRHISWLDYNFPQHSPVEYERDGIEISDEGYARVTRPVSSHTVGKLQTGLIDFPYNMAYTTLLFIEINCRRFAKHTSSQAAEYLGLQGLLSKDIPSQVGSRTDKAVEEMVARRNQQRQQQQQREQQQQQRGKKSPGAESTKEADKAAKSDDPNDKTGTESNTLELNTQLGRITIPKVQDLMLPTIITQLSKDWWRLALHERATVLRTRRFDPPRGCINLSGLVKIHGDEGNVTIDVHAWYDPVKQEFDPESTIFTVRAQQMKSTRPLGGP